MVPHSTISFIFLAVRPLALGITVHTRYYKDYLTRSDGVRHAKELRKDLMAFHKKVHRIVQNHSIVHMCCVFETYKL